MPSIIPVVHCFDNNYVIAASVSFLSMLKNASKDYFYKLYVLHSDITESNQLKLHEIVSRFDNASLEFINAKNKLESLIPPPITKKLIIPMRCITNS